MILGDIMKILKYEKKNNGMYQVFFDNNYNVDINEELILKNQLLIKKELTEKELEVILQENEKYIAYNIAIKYISIKMRSKKEIREYLTKKNINDIYIDEVILMLEKERYLDDLRYAQAYVNDKVHLSNDGPNKIKMKLKEHEINGEDISKALESFSFEIQKEKIDKIIAKQINSNRNKSSYMLKNKIITYLTGLGYGKEVIMSSLNNIEIKNDKELYNKEYQKIYKKLSKKYSGDELLFKVRQKMYSMGFKDIE